VGRLGPGQPWTLPSKEPLTLLWSMRNRLEEKFVQEGFGTERIDLMLTTLLLSGPPSDPAGIKGIKQVHGGAEGDLPERVTSSVAADESGTMWQKWNYGKRPG